MISRSTRVPSRSINGYSELEIFHIAGNLTNPPNMIQFLDGVNLVACSPWFNANEDGIIWKMDQ